MDGWIDGGWLVLVSGGDFGLFSDTLAVWAMQ